MAHLSHPISEVVEGLINSCVNGQLDHLHGFLEQAQNIDPSLKPTPQYLLQVAAKNGQVEAVRYLFDSLPACRHREPWTPELPDGLVWNTVPPQWPIYEDGVIYAAIEGINPVEIFKVFFAYGMSPNHNLDRGVSPLRHAIGSRFEFAKFLLQKGADPNGRLPFEKDTFLGVAAINPTPEMLNLLVHYGARLQGSHALRQAAEYHRIDNAKRLLELGVDVNEIFTKPVYDSSNPPCEAIWGCALHFAIKGGPLHRTVTNSPTEMVQFLLQRGAQANILDGDGKTPLQVAKRARKRDIIRVFRENGIQD